MYRFVISYQQSADPILPEPTPDMWLPEPNQPPRAHRRSLAALLGGGLGYVGEPITGGAINIPMDGWFKALSEPLFSKSRPALGDFAVDPTALLQHETVLVDEWFMPLSQPLHALPRFMVWQYLGYLEPAEPPAVDSWWRQLETPPKARRRAASYDIGVYVGEPITPPAPPPTATPDAAGWLPELPVNTDWTPEDPL